MPTNHAFPLWVLISMAVSAYEGGYLTRYGVAVDVERILEDEQRWTTII